MTQRLVSNTGAAQQAGSGYIVTGPIPATIASGGTLLSSSTVVTGGVTSTTGAVFYAGAIAAAAKAGNAGNGTVGGLSLGQGAPAGAYTVAFTSATAFTVIAPGGATAAGTVGTAFSGFGGLAFTITAGSNAFAAGDAIILTTAPPAAATVLKGGGGGDDVTILLP